MFTENTKVTGKRPCQGMPSGTTAHSHTGYLPVSPDAGHPLSSVSLQSFQNNWHPLPAGCQGFPHRHSRSAQNSGWHVSGCPFSRSSMPRSAKTLPRKEACHDHKQCRHAGWDEIYHIIQLCRKSSKIQVLFILISHHGIHGIHRLIGKSKHRSPTAR